jgi:hypothetical protein
VIDGLDRFLKFRSGLGLLLEKTVLVGASDDAWGYGLWIPAPDAVVIFNVKGARRILGIRFPIRHS